MILIICIFSVSAPLEGNGKICFVNELIETTKTPMKLLNTTTANVVNLTCRYSGGAVDWSADWDSDGSENAFAPWDKKVTDYVTVTPTSDGALTAKVTCLQAFGCKVEITVQSRTQSTDHASCICDYRKKIEGISFADGSQYGEDEINLDSGKDPFDYYPTIKNLSYSLNWNLSAVYSYYSLDDTFTYDVEISGTEAMQEALNNDIGYPADSIITTSIKALGSFPVTTDDVWQYLYDTEGIDGNYYWEGLRNFSRLSEVPYMQIHIIGKSSNTTFDRVINVYASSINF